MELVAQDGKKAEMALTRDELTVLHYAVSELLAKTDEWEFPILVGAPVDTAKQLRSELSKAIEQRANESD